MWFKKLTGFEDTNYKDVQSKIRVNGNRLESLVNGKSYQYGKLEVLSLQKIKEVSLPREVYKGTLKVTQIIGDTKNLHNDEENKNAMFQAASQFNLLEMVGPHVSPENGVDCYERDHTQGPACAIACGAGTIYRNYFAPVNGQTGQTIHNQIDCLDDIGSQLKNKELNLWNMRNGYALPNQKGILHINKTLHSLSIEDREALKEKLKIGIQSDTEVTSSTSGHLVNQVYCSALPVSYSQLETMYFEAFARLILEATYEATFYAALRNLDKTGCNLLYLTLVGGGAFGNRKDWILDSRSMAISKFRSVPLEVKVVSFCNIDESINSMINNS